MGANTVSSEILGKWYRNIGSPSYDYILRQLPSRVEIDLKERSFADYFRNKNISGGNSEIIGRRLLAIVEYFSERHMAQTSVIDKEDLPILQKEYSDLPPRYLLALERIQYKLYPKSQSRIFKQYSVSGEHWKDTYKDWSNFSFIIDDYGCIRASSIYGWALRNNHSVDAPNDWHWWHRLSLINRNNKQDVRGYGVVADQYYLQQMIRFRQNINKKEELMNNPRFRKLFSLLVSHPESKFLEYWKRAKLSLLNGVSPEAVLPVPFFRPDGTYFWLYETLTQMENDLTLVVRFETDPITADYLANIRREIDKKREKEGKEHKSKAIFIDDYFYKFNPQERFALGLINEKGERINT